MKNEILELFKENRVVNEFSLNKGSFSSSSLIGESLLIASSFRKNPRKILLLTNSLHKASLFCEYLSNLLNEEEILTFFSDETIQIDVYTYRKKKQNNSFCLS